MHEITFGIVAPQLGFYIGKRRSSTYLFRNTGDFNSEKVYIVIVTVSGPISAQN